MECTTNIIIMRGLQSTRSKVDRSVHYLQDLHFAITLCLSTSLNAIICWTCVRSDLKDLLFKIFLNPVIPLRLLITEVCNLHTSIDAGSSTNDHVEVIKVVWSNRRHLRVVVPMMLIFILPAVAVKVLDFTPPSPFARLELQRV